MHRRQNIRHGVMRLLNMKNRQPVGQADAREDLKNDSMGMGMMASASDGGSKSQFLGKQAELPPTSAMLGAMAGSGVGGALQAMPIGGLLGAGYGHAKGRTLMGGARGAARGLTTGAGVGMGSMAGGMLGHHLSGGDSVASLLGSLAGAGLGGVAGYHAATPVIGDKMESADEKMDRQVDEHLAKKKQASDRQAVIKLLLKQAGLLKESAQDNTGKAVTATGEGTHLSYQHKPDHYMQGQEAWASVGNYLKKKPHEEPNPFVGRHKSAREFDADEKAQIDKGQSRLLPKLFPSYATPMTEMMASPGQQGLGMGALGGLGGAALGAHFGGGTGAAIGGIGGAGLLGGLTYLSRKAQNEDLEEVMRRNPKGANRHDFLADPVVNNDLNRDTTMGAAGVMAGGLHGFGHSKESMDDWYACGGDEEMYKKTLEEKRQRAMKRAGWEGITGHNPSSFPAPSPLTSPQPTTHPEPAHSTDEGSYSGTDEKSAMDALDIANFIAEGAILSRLV